VAFFSDGFLLEEEEDDEEEEEEEEEEDLLPATECNASELDERGSFLEFFSRLRGC